MKKDRFILLLSAFVALIFAAPSILAFHKMGGGGLARLYSAHVEGVSLSTYGKWWIVPPHYFLTDAFSGDFHSFYNYLGDAFLNLLAAVFSLPPMAVQAAFLGPLLGGLFFLSCFYSIRSVWKNPKTALGSSLLITLGSNSHLMELWDHPGNAHLNMLLHVPAHTISLGIAQSFGWVFFLPVLALFYRAFTEYSRSRALTFGAALGLLFHLHTLTFINVTAIMLVFILMESYATDRWIRRRLDFYIWSGVPAFLIASPYLYFLLVYARGNMNPGLGNAMAVSVLELVSFFSVYLLLAVLGLKIGRRSSVSPSALRWVLSMVAVNLVLGFNHWWGWGNHPYRFVINLIFPFSILAVHGFQVLRVSPKRHWRWIGRFAFAWLLGIILFNSTRFLAARPLYAGIRTLSTQDLNYLQKIRAQTVPGHYFLNPVEYTYPEGTFQSSILMNFSRSPGYFPDFRYELERERYHDRLALFCFLFPGFPHFEIQFGFHACETTPSPPFAILDPRLKNQILAIYGIEYAASYGEPFASALKRGGHDYAWSTLAWGSPRNAGVTDTFWKISMPVLAGVARFERGLRTENRLETAFFNVEPGQHTLLVGTRIQSKDKGLPEIRIDNHEPKIHWLAPGWAKATIHLKVGKHLFQIEAPRKGEPVFFVALIEEKRMSRYIGKGGRLH